MIGGSAIVLTNGWLDEIHAKTAHGLLRRSERFEILCLVDPKDAGKDAGEILDGKRRGIPIYATVTKALERLAVKPHYCLVGVAMHGGQLPANLRSEILTAMRNGLSIVSGLHSLLCEDPEFSRVAAECGVKLIDIRKPRPTGQLHFWSGKIYSMKTPRIALLGTDCAVGKRTTGQFLVKMCRENNIRAEMIYTGQTGWMQGWKHGFIFDATVNDFIGGEIERVIVECERESKPDLIFIEGQSSLRNPSGPCGAEFLLSGDVRAVILQHAPGREFFDGLENNPRGRVPDVKEEIELIRFYGAQTLAVTLKEENWDDRKMKQYQADLGKHLGIPVVRPLKEGVERLLPVVREYIGSF